MRPVARRQAPRLNAPPPWPPSALAMRSLRRFAESPLYPIPLRGWHAGSLEPHVLEQHLRLAFDRAALAEMVDMFDWAAERRFGGESRTTSSASRSSICRSSSSPARTTTSRRPRACAPASTGAAPATRRTESLPLGHIDLLVGRDAPLMTWPLVTSWLGKRAA